jgi:methylphosphotriester-DNA--protein-cysteine methyltransferase
MMHDHPNDSARWIAVQRRDPAADGTFVYAVRTTKIYCRPVCKARLARRANVSFYADARGAAKAGYRPCKRCKPEDRKMPRTAAVARIQTMIQQGLTNDAPTPPASDASESDDAQTTEELARRAQVSKWHFHRIFKDLTGVTPPEYLRRQQTKTIPVPDMLGLDQVMRMDGLVEYDAFPPTMTRSCDEGFQQEQNSIIDWPVLSDIQWHGSAPQDTDLNFFDWFSEDVLLPDCSNGPSHQ